MDNDAEAPPVERQGSEEKRRPYVKPRLVVLGSVRKLTFGGSSGFVDGAGTFMGSM